MFEVELDDEVAGAEGVVDEVDVLGSELVAETGTGSSEFWD